MKLFKKLFLCAGLVFCGVSALHAKYTLEASLNVLDMMIKAKPIVSAHMVFAEEETKSIWDKFNEVREKVMQSSYSPEKKTALLEALVKRSGARLITSTQKFFDVLHEFRAQIEPAVEAGLKEKGFDSSNSIILEFLQIQDEEVARIETRILTIDGFSAVVGELQVLFSYFYKMFPTVYPVGKEYLDNLRKEEKAKEVERAAEAKKLADAEKAKK